MTTWYVQAGSGSGDGSEAAPFGTLAAANAVAMPGDVVEIGGGIYREKHQPTRGTTWRGAEGAKVIFDGGWNGKALADGAGQENWILVKEQGVTVKGITIRNIKGNGIAVAAGGDDFTAEDCIIHDTHGGAVGVNGTGTRIRRPTFRRCTTLRTSRSWETIQKGVQGNFIFRYVDDGLVEDCLIMGGFGEALAAGVETGRRLADGTEVMGLTVRGCVIHSFMHLLLYASNRARNVRIENCVLYQTGDPYFLQGDGQVGEGFIIGNELSGDAKDRGRQRAENVVIEGCLVVNTTGLGIRNNLKDDGQDGYHTDIQNLQVRRCTFVGGEYARMGISTVENPRKPPSVRGVFERNLFVLDAVPNQARAWNVNTPDVVFRNNAFTTAVPAKAVGNDNFAVPLSALINPLARVTGTATDNNFNLDNYRPAAGGVLDGANIGALKALVIEPPDPPEEPEPPGEPVVKPDWDTLLEQAAAVGAQLAVQAEANRNRWSLLEALREAEAVFSLAQEQAAAELGELLLKLDEYKQAAD